MAATEFETRNQAKLALTLVIGISGGVASGKRTVARMLKDLGAKVLDADRIGHEVLKEDVVKNELMEIWGDRIFSGVDIDRKRLANIVFDPVRGVDALAKLEAITHPRIRQRIERQLDELSASDCPVVVLDAPLLFKAGWDRMCQKLLFVDVDERVRLNRASQRGWSETDLQDRENRQTPLPVKRARSTDTVDNSGDLADTFSQLKRIWEQWGLKVPPLAGQQWQ